MSLLYIGTFGSFIGFGFAFGQVLQVQFASSFQSPVDAAYLTFLGPLLGSLIRPVGGALADRLGGARVTSWNFVAMAWRAGVVLVASGQHSLPLFLAGFVALFVVQRGRQRVDVQDDPGDLPGQDRGDARPPSDDALRRPAGCPARSSGLAGAIGAFGGVLVNVAFRQSFLTTKTGDGAYIAFIAFYALCVLVTWYVYLRPSPKRLAGGSEPNRFAPASADHATGHDRRRASR